MFERRSIPRSYSQARFELTIAVRQCRSWLRTSPFGSLPSWRQTSRFENGPANLKVTIQSGCTSRNLSKICPFLPLFQPPIPINVKGWNREIYDRVESVDEWNVDGDGATNVDLPINRVYDVVLRCVGLHAVDDATRRLVLDRDCGLWVRAALAHLAEL